MSVLAAGEEEMGARTIFTACRAVAR